MSEGATDRGLVKTILRGNDGKIRATYRVGLGLVAFFGALLVSQFVVVAAGLSITLTTATLSTLLAAMILIALFYVVWAQRLDQRPLAEYGLELSPSGFGQFVAVFAITLVGFGLWYGVWAAAGQLSVDVVLSSEGSLLIGTLLVLVQTTAGAVAQDLVFLGLIFTNSVEGLDSRVGNRTVALGGAIVATALLFVAYHFLLGAGAAGFLPPLQAIVFLLVGLGYFAAVYLYTGSLLGAIGAHAAVNFSGFVYRWEQVGTSAPFPFPELLSVSGSTPLTDVLGPAPLLGVTISFVLLVVGTRALVVNTDTTILSTQS